MVSSTQLEWLRNTLSNRRVYRLISFTTLSISIFVLFLPAMYITSIPLRLSESVYAHTLLTSDYLRAAHCCSITCGLPLLIELILDAFSTMKGLYYSDRSLLLIIIIIPSILYLLLFKHPIIPILYVAMVNAQFSVIISVVTSFFAESSPDPATKRFMIPVYYVGVISNYLSNNLQIFIYAASGSESYRAQVAANVFYYISTVAFLIMTLRWVYFIYHLKITKEDPQYDSYIICNTYLGGLWGVFISVVVVSVNSELIYTANNTVLIVYVINFLLFAILTSILPGRLIRLRASNTEVTLGLKRMFVRYVSHEIRSPLNVVYAGLEYLESKLKRSLPENNEVIELLEEICVANETALNILNDLLHYESMDAGTFSVELTGVPLKGFLAKKLQPLLLFASKHEVNLNIIDNVGVVERYSQSESTDNDLQRKSFPFHAKAELEDIRTAEPFGPKTQFYSKLDLSEDFKAGERSSTCQDVAGFIRIDPYRIDQVIRNLVTNAIKFTPVSGTVSIEFSVVKYSSPLPSPFTKGTLRKLLSADREAFNELRRDCLRISVSDTGVGIAAEDQTKMFTEFKQFEKNKLQQGGGSGLGLWICKKIVQLHNGKIRVESEGRGLGSTFIVEIPVFTAEECGILPSKLQPIESSSDRLPLETIMRTVSLDSQGLTQMNNGLAGAKGASLFKSRSNGVILQRKEMELASGKIDRVTSKTELCDEKDAIALNIDDVNRSSLRVMIVDDSVMNRKIIRRVLESEALLNTNLVDVSIEIYEADDGLSAIQLMKDMRSTTGDLEDLARPVAFDLVLMDYLMKSMHGPETAAFMRASLSFQGRIVGITGNSLEEDIVRYKNSGADNVLLKPVSSASIAVEIMKVLPSP